MQFAPLPDYFDSLGIREKCNMKIIFLKLVLVLLVSCATQQYPSYRLGQFTVSSSHNVRNLNYSVEDKTKAKTKGEDCYIIGKEQPNDSRLQRAMDKAIQNGRDKGVDGDLLVNVRIDQRVTSKRTGFLLLFKEDKNCMTVTGDLVKVE